MPRNDIAKSLRELQAFQSSSDEKCDSVIDQCRGLDRTEIVDDAGQAQKTLSVENSFRRNSVTSLDAVWRGLSDLFVRLPILLRDRASWSSDPDRAYPTTIRLTIRAVDNSLAHKHKRRPYRTRSKQATVDGKYLLQERDSKALTNNLKRSISPLLANLLGHPKPNSLNVTRMNIALTNFRDVPSPPREIRSSPGRTSRSSHFLPHDRATESKVRPVEKGHESSPRTTSAVTFDRVKPMSKSVSAVSSSTPSRQKKRMKATRIDNFFWKK